MPSDVRIAQALEALAEPIASYRSMLANTSEQIRLLINTRVERNGSSAEVASAELGAFASGRIDPERMAKARLLDGTKYQALVTREFSRGHPLVMSAAVQHA